ncbi:MAG: glycosyltransferase [Acidimicrobiia bacterium]
MTVTGVSARDDHLSRLTGPHGLFEHACFDEPRRNEGYTLDDNARAVVVTIMTTREPSRADLEPYLGFLMSAPTPAGWHNRMSESGDWVDDSGPDDTCGRAFWGLGALAEARLHDDFAVELLSRVTSFETPHLRSLAYAMLGAAAALRAGVLESAMEAFLVAALRRIPSPTSPRWAWPEGRLTYANGRIPQAIIAAGALVDDTALLMGLDLLHWLIETERGKNGFSFTPVGGWEPGEPRPGFDQQPIEAWAMSDACATAFAVDCDELWRNSARMAAEWFQGENDTGIALYDPHTGGGYDGLHVDGVNQNQGAESTLAALGALAGWEGLEATACG